MQLAADKYSYPICGLVGPRVVTALTPLDCGNHPILLMAERCTATMLDCSNGRVKRASVRSELEGVKAGIQNGPEGPGYSGIPKNLQTAVGVV